MADVASVDVHTVVEVIRRLGLELLRYCTGRIDIPTSPRTASCSPRVSSVRVAILSL